MLWCSLPELSLIVGLIMIILYGLFSLNSATIESQPGQNQKNVHAIQHIKLVNMHLCDVYFFSRLWPIMFLLGYAIDFTIIESTSLLSTIAYPTNNGIDILLIILTVVIMQSFRSFESILLLLLAFIGQIFMLHSCDLVSFYICLEIQNFAFLVLCGLQPRTLNINKIATVISNRPLAGVEASIKYLLLSAFSSGVLLFWFSVLYLRTGITTLSFGPLTATSFDSDSFIDYIPQMLILIALMFKLGGAPLHIWMIDIYGGVKRQLIMYIATAPKLSLFGFWISTWHSVWTDFTVIMFVAFSMIIGCIGAYNQPTLRALFAYSTVNEIGLMLMAIETAGFHSLLQHLTIYIVSMLLLWNNSDKRLFALLAISLAGLPPLAGFFGKAFIFNSVAIGAMAGPYVGILVISLLCTGLSLVYYLRVFRLFSMGIASNNQILPAGLVGLDSNTSVVHNMNINTRSYSYTALDLNDKLTSACIVFLIFAPLFIIKPFVL